ncbi:S8 family serine peptidase [Streptomyces sp. NBC_00441]|uniref:S8 family serine peptidase n=1 Tax=Streptomyces sp. NBC_00441 TaxID=2975742 RepID=UPI002E2844FD|nr:S8 family serine peptidase [Streptomyces sp. NBC_00441]
MGIVGRHGRASAVVAALGALLLLGGAVAPAATADTMRERQWYLDRMQAPAMWKVSTGEGITVAVLDTGVIPTVPELTGRVLKGKNFMEPKRGADQDTNGHGTAMAMLIAGNGANDQGVKGLAPDARILPLTVWGTTKEAGFRRVDALVDALRYAADSEARIIDIGVSFHTSVDDDERDSIKQAVDYAIGRGKLLLTDTGDTGEDGNDVTYPSAIPGVVGVGAVDTTSTVTKFSAYGPQVALAAPGVDIPIRCLEGKPGYCRSQGTGQATALASASAALIWSRHPDWTGNQVLRILMNTAGRPTEDTVPSRYLGYGTIRPRLALLEDPGDPGPADVNPLVAAHEATTPSASPSAPTPSASPSRRSFPDATPVAVEGADRGHGSTVWIVTGAVAAAVLALGAVLLVRRRKRPARITEYGVDYTRER